MKRTSAITVSMLLLVMSGILLGDEGWDEREARAVRQTVYPAIEHLQDFAQIRDAFEKGLASDASAATALAALTTHANEDVASTAAQMVGRFPGPAGATALKESYATDARVVVRAGALAGLARMNDPAAGTLASAALASEDEMLRGAGLGALEALANSAYAPAILQYLTQHPDELDSETLESLGKMGDPPGSTAVRTRLLAEANNKSQQYALRYSAALGLQAMGLASLVQPVLDFQKAEDTHQALFVLKGAMTRLAATRSVTVTSQAALDPLLRDVALSSKRYKMDLWGRPVRPQFVSEGVFHAISDGPDKATGTPDDLSTAEAWPVYARRIFPDLFVAQ